MDAVDGAAGDMELHYRHHVRSHVATGQVAHATLPLLVHQDPTLPVHFICTVIRVSEAGSSNAIRWKPGLENTTGLFEKP